VRNTRAGGEAEISFAGRFETLHINRHAFKYGRRTGADCWRVTSSVARPIDVTPNSPLDQFVTEASRHPVFLPFDRQPATGDWRLATGDWRAKLSHLRRNLSPW